MEEQITIEDIKKIPLLDDRQQKECLLAVTYERDFQHGTDGHNRLVLIARLVRLLITMIRRCTQQEEAIQGWRRQDEEQKLEIVRLRVANESLVERLQA